MGFRVGGVHAGLNVLGAGQATAISQAVAEAYSSGGVSWGLGVLGEVEFSQVVRVYLLVVVRLVQYLRLWLRLTPQEG